MTSIPLPLQKIDPLLALIGLKPEELDELVRFRPAIAKRKEEFAARFLEAFLRFGETQTLLEPRDRAAFLLKAWGHWLDRLFSGKLDRDFFAYLWKIGVRHVDVNLDQRYSNVGFALARQFCHEVLAAEAPAERLQALSRAVDKIMDVCVLVETTAYIEASTRCDMEVILGVADRVRTPATVIGGSLRRLQRSGGGEGEVARLYETLFSENQRLERMVSAIETYAHVFTHEPELTPCALDPFVRRAIENLAPAGKREGTRIDVALDPAASSVRADSKDLEFLLRCLLQNALDAVSGETPLIRITSRPRSYTLHAVDLEIFNTGIPPKPEDIDQLFSPFYSTKPSGTGFGLPTAKIAARKNSGQLRLIPVPGEGTRAVLTLLRP